MLRALMINAESLDWCGINGIFVFWTEIEDEEMALNAALEEYEGAMREYLYSEFYTSDTDDEDYIEEDEAGFTFNPQFYTEEVYGDVRCAAYQHLN